MKIRLARANEFSRLQQIEGEAGLQFHDVGMPDVAAIPPSDLDELRFALAEALLWVAELPDAGPVGFAMAEKLRESLHLEEVSVLPSHGRQGVGSALVRHAMRAAAALGFEQLTLSTFAEVPWNRPFYERLGFRVIPEGELAPELSELRRREERDGLPTDRRVMMSIATSENLELP